MGTWKYSISLGPWKSYRVPDTPGSLFSGNRRYTGMDLEIFFFPLFFLCSKEHFSIFFVQYLGVTAGIEPAT